MPNHIPWAAIGAPYAHWMKNVSQRNAPGAISAIAFDVNPVSPRVDGGFVAAVGWVAMPLLRQGRAQRGTRLRRARFCTARRAPKVSRTAYAKTGAIGARG